MFKNEHSEKVTIYFQNGKSRILTDVDEIEIDDVWVRVSRLHDKYHTYRTDTIAEIVEEDT